MKRILKNLVKKIYYYFFFPYTRVHTYPNNSPSIQSIYYKVNQLGKNKPIGLPREHYIVYHQLPFPELKLRYRRKDLEERLKVLCSTFDFENKFGIDIGSAIGGITFALQKRGAIMVGIERDEPAFKVSLEVESYFKTGAKFINDNLSKPNLKKSLKIVGCKKFDFSIWLSSFNWVAGANNEKNLKEIISYLSHISDTLIADSAIGGKGQKFLDKIGIKSNKDFSKYILENSEYTSAHLIHTYENWYSRGLFRFDKK